MLLLWLACTGSSGVDVVRSERGGPMVKIPGGTVRIGPRQTPPVAGFAAPTPAQVAPGQGLSSNHGQGASNPGAPPDSPPDGVHAPAKPLNPPGSAPLPPREASGPPGGAAAPGVPGGGVGAGAAQPLPDLGLPPDQRAAPPVVPLPTAPLGPTPMGSGAERIIAEVTAYLIDLTEVTRAEYSAFLVDTGYRAPFVDEPWAEEDWNWSGPEGYPSGTADHPVTMVSWFDAAAYCSWAGKRLPTEAEWQLAVLGSIERDQLFPWGNEYKEGAHNHGSINMPFYDDSDGYARTSPVGAFPAGDSPYGLKDGFGNAWEWVADRRVMDKKEYLGTRKGDRIVNPHTEGPGLYAGVRGGAFFFDLRPNPGGEFNGFLNELRRKSSGFRCAKDLD